MTTHIAIIGTGGQRQGKEGFAIGHMHARSWQALKEHDLQLCAVDIHPANLQAFAEKFAIPSQRCFASTEALYAALTPDVVSICTWPGLHAQQVIQAAQAGVKAIVCEKPLALDPDQMNQMIANCQRMNCHLVVAHQRRYDPAFEAARDILRQGKLGDRLILEARVGDHWDMLSWTVHWFDIASFLLDDQPVRILAGVDHRMGRRYQHAVENESVVFVTYSQGHQGIFITGPEAILSQPICIRGEKGELRLGGSEMLLLTRDGSKVIPVPHANGFPGLFTDVLQVLQGQLTQTRCSVGVVGGGDMGTRMAYAAQESARVHQTLELEHFHVGYAPMEVLQHPPTSGWLVDKAVLLADPHHRDPATGLSGLDGVRAALGACVAQHVAVVPAEQRELVEADLSGCGLLVIYHTQKTASPAQQEVIQSHVEKGLPLLVVHCGIGAYANWPVWREWIGRYWVWPPEATASQPASVHPHLPTSLRVDPASQAFFPWQEAWLPRDEVYGSLGQASAVQVLATMHAQDGSDTIAEPAIWRSTVKPNIVVSLPGHRHDLWQLPAMRQQLHGSAKAALTGD